MTGAKGAESGPDGRVRLAVLAVVGPTAAGKSDLAVSLALRLGGEIVNADSMQLYRGMDIGTAKLPPEQRHGVRHHMIDVLDIGETSTVAEFQQRARSAIADCQARDVLPIVVGGSALYVRAVLDRFDFPGTDAHVRGDLEAELARVGPQALHRRLAAADPEAAERILPTNGRRIVRALEVMALTGRPFAANLPGHAYAFDGVRQVGLDVPRDVLDGRIEARVDRMWAEGFVDEVRRLVKAGLRDGVTARRALGYRQVLEHLAPADAPDVPDAGDPGRERAAREATVRATRRFARRQDSWFRRDPRITWLAYDSPDLLERAVVAACQPAAPCAPPTGAGSQ